MKSQGVSLFHSLCNLSHLPGTTEGETEIFPQGAPPLWEGCSKACSATWSREGYVSPYSDLSKILLNNLKKKKKKK